MSIVRQLVQIAVVEALRDRTAALGNVFDSKMDTIDGLLKGGSAPVLVFSIEETAEDADSATDGFLGRPGRLTAIMQSAVASGKEIEDGNGATIVPELGETDSAYEALLNIVDRQWRAVLHDHDNSWATVFRDLVVSIGTIRSLRATDPETGTKHACRFAQIEMDVLPEPLPGDDLPDAIDAGLTLMENDGDGSYAVLASSWRGILAQGADWQNWRKLQSELFASTGDMHAAGLAPIAPDEDGEAAEVESVSIEMAGAKGIEVTGS